MIKIIISVRGFDPHLAVVFFFFFQTNSVLVWECGHLPDHTVTLAGCTRLLLTYSLILA
jgi:hypothetical protein